MRDLGGIVVSGRSNAFCGGGIAGVDRAGRGQHYDSLAGGCRLKVGNDASMAALRRVMTALRG
jgi:hypothetical protein